ncbi:hypothetical protein [Amycolatopsis sp. 195334CR]|uniref:hypothetical protein n=1 Tax=Amycolatopsis sp. 195334CR TaxID=2814588 RepID=UPI001A90866C|nr:hypothetical protein [Amycolatopsis sp. 195334CR]MBN6034208.1 hypothetical protein [Amycolatopsis sp. 195334CR]
MSNENTSESGKHSHSGPDARLTSRPRDVFGGKILHQLILAQNQNAVVMLTSTESFPEGCLFNFFAAVRLGDKQENQWIYDFEHQRKVLFSSNEEARPEEFLFLGVSHGRHSPLPSDRIHEQEVVANPVSTAEPAARLIGSKFEVSQSLWLTPLPNREAVQVVTEWPKVNFGFHETLVDGAELHRAASEARPFWT